MHSKLAGHLPLQDMIAQTLESARSKLAAAEEKEEGKKKGFVPFGKKTEGKAHEKGESKKEEKEEHESGSEKTSSVLDFSDPYSMDKLASALEELGDEFIKEADSIENGGESKQGGEQLATMNPVGGKQVYTGAKATAKHQVTTGGMKATKDNPGAATANETDDNRAPGGTGAKYPAKGVLKTAGEFPFGKKKEEKKESKKEEHEEHESEKDEKKEKKSGVAALQEAVEKVAFERSNKFLAPHHKNEERGQERGRQAGAIGGAALGAGTGIAGGIAQGLRHPGGKGAKALSAIGHALAGGTAGGVGGGLVGRAAGGSLGKTVGVMKGPGKDKKSSAVDFILDKLAEFHGGGETLDDKPAPVPSNEGRQLIASNKAPVSATKREAKGPGRKQLSEVLSEPAQTKSTDSTVQDNLRNAAKGGVKIAAVKAYLSKIAEAGCVCAGAGECDYCRMKASVDKKRADKKVKQSLGMPPMGPAPQAGGPMGGGSAGGM